MKMAWHRASSYAKATDGGAGLKVIHLSLQLMTREAQMTAKPNDAKGK